MTGVVALAGEAGRSTFWDQGPRQVPVITRKANRAIFTIEN